MRFLTPQAGSSNPAQRGFLSGFNIVNYEYDLLGRQIRRSRPHTGTPEHYTEYTYDSLARSLRVKNPDGSERTLEHRQFLSTLWDERGLERRLTFDVNGRVVKRTELLNEFAEAHPLQLRAVQSAARGQGSGRTLHAR